MYVSMMKICSRLGCEINFIPLRNDVSLVSTCQSSHYVWLAITSTIENTANNLTNSVIIQEYQLGKD